MKGTAPAGHFPNAQAPPLRGIDETNVSTEQPTTQAHARLPRPHEQPRRSSGVEAATRQRPQAADSQHSTEATLLRRTRAGQRLPRTKRIRRRGEFLKLERVGRRRVGTYFVVITAPRPDGPSRLGITVSRRVGGAVVRNRVKRMVREFFRRSAARISPAHDVLVIARPRAADVSYADARQELATALKVTAED
jgi:ribonuclease P protein component